MLKMAVVEDIKEDSDTLGGYVEKVSEETAERIDIRVFGNAGDFLGKYSSGVDCLGGATGKFPVRRFRSGGKAVSPGAAGSESSGNNVDSMG